MQEKAPKKYSQQEYQNLKNELVHAYEELSQSYEQLELVQELSHVGSWRWNMATDEAYWSDEMYRIYGVTPEQFYPSHENVAQTVVPEDLEKMNQVVENLLQNNTFSPFEFRIRRPSGEIRYLYILALEKKVNNETNQPWLFGVTQDISHYKKAELTIQKSLQEKELLVKELFHRTKNNMQVISSMLSLNALYLDEPKIESVFQEMQNRIYAMALAHDKLLHARDLSKIELSDYISDLVEWLKRDYIPSEQQISFFLELQSLEVSIDIAIPCGLIIYELVTNAVKYSFADNQKGTIHIELKIQQEQLQLVIADNGIGMPDNFDIEQTNSYGLQTVYQLVEYQLGGSLQWKSLRGSQFTIIIDSIKSKVRV